MANIFDYIQWRDIKIEQVEFNEIDNLILSRLSYFSFDGIIKTNERITVKEAYRRYIEWGSTGRILMEQDPDLFKVLAESVRFGDLYLSEYINKLDSIQEKQFSSITIEMPDDSIYVAYRGTDSTIVGWKEDFNMSFSELVPAQTDAVDYLDDIAKKYKGKIRVGGHSKGGNLAIYAAAFCEPKVQKRIINVYNNDGPGFCDKVIETKEFKSILNRVHTYIPQASIIGRLLNHPEEITVLKSTQNGIMQHDLYSWQVLGDKFVEEELTDSSEFIDKTINNWLKEVSPQKREKFVDTLFEILKVTQVETLDEIKTNLFENAKLMMKEYQNLDQDTKNLTIQTLKTFVDSGKRNLVKRDTLK